MPRHNYVGFFEAKKFARSLNLKSRAKWEECIASDVLPSDIPKYPSSVYAEHGWTSWGDFLGNGNRAPKDYNYRHFPDARLFVRSLGLKNTTEWKKWAASKERSHDIPKNPAQAYRKKGWVNFADFLGTKTIPNRRTFPPFDMARDFAKTLKLESKKEWIEWHETHQPLEWAKWPNQLYKDTERYNQKLWMR